MKILKMPETYAALGMFGGILIGIGMDNIGAGVGIGIALGIPAYVSGKKKETKDITKTEEDPQI
jgi:phage tail tube protein FII